MNRNYLLAFMALGFALLAPGAFGGTAEDYKQGHSHGGSAFDSGPRQQPWVMAGIGEAHFPITTKNPEVQKWFDQGNALLHSFWYYEAERSFRWCLKLEPGNAMAYWGLSRATDGTRAEEFIREALKRKESVSERERLYIDAQAALTLADPLRDKDGAPDYDARSSRFKKVMESLCVKFPSDMEARAWLALNTMGSDRYGTELMIREILVNQPNHPGAHHYRIHNWDYHEPEQALESCRRYSEIAFGIGHALHMPGHIYSILGMWNEAAISMDEATRAEKKYMSDTLTFPFNQWNYGHNRYYLSYIQEQLGMPTAAMFGARQLIDAPQDPVDNTDQLRSEHSYGISGLTRALLNYERWDDLLNDKTIPWRADVFSDKCRKAYFQARAWFGKGDLEQATKAVAEHAALKGELDKNKDMEREYGIEETELKARLAIARGETIQGLGLMADAAQREFEMQREYADPPIYPEALYIDLGEAYLTAKSPNLAAEAFEKALTLTHNDLFALSGMVRAYAALGDKTKAQNAMAELLFVSADAEPGLQVIERAKATGIVAEAHDNSPGPQRNYLRTSLEKFGPNRWEPYPAPVFDVRDQKGKRVTLDEYRGKNVMLVYYLGAECPHCMLQLHDIAKKKDDWARLDTELLAVSSANPTKNSATVKAFGDLPFRLLSDEDHLNARRFHAYDDFEDLELHATILIDKKGRVYWARFGGDPFKDTDYLVKQLERMNAMVTREDGLTGGTEALKPSASAGY